MPDKVIVVVHGSRAQAWVELMERWFAGVRDRISSGGRPAIDPELSFLELCEPLFETRLRAAVASGAAPWVFPFFLSASGHAGEEIPSMVEECLGSEGLARLISPAGFDAALGANAARRLRALGAMPGDAVVVSGYGASSHDDAWRRLVAAIRDHAGEYAAGPDWLWAPAGHFLADSSAPLRESLQQISRAGSRRSAILPLYLSVSSYQRTLIPAVIGEFPDLEILYRPDAVLPDSGIEEWAASRIREAVSSRSTDFRLPIAS